MFYQLKDAYYQNQNNKKAVAGSTKKLATSTLKGMSFEKLAKHAHSYAKAHRGNGMAIAYFDGRNLSFSREITEQYKLNLFGINGRGQADRKTIIEIITTRLYNA